MAITTSGTLTQEFVDQLSAELLLKADAQYVFAQLAGAARAGSMGIPDIQGAQGAGGFGAAMNNGMGSLAMADERFMSVARDFAKVVSEPTDPGKVILVDRPNYLAGTMTETSRRLTEGTAVSATPQALTMGQVSVTIREYSGPHDGTNVAPVGITEFLKRRSRHNMVEFVGQILRRDRNKWFDSVVVEFLNTTTNALTVLGDAESAALPGATMSEAALSRALRRLQERNVPTYSSGQYLLVIQPRHLEELRNSSAFRESMRYLAASGPLATGHLADFGGFHIFMSNNLGTVAVGSGGGVTGYPALAFGPQAFGWAIGMDVEARRSKDDDYGRQDKVLWLAHEGFALLDATFVERISST